MLPEVVLQKNILAHKAAHKDMQGPLSRLSHSPSVQRRGLRPGWVHTGMSSAAIFCPASSAMGGGRCTPQKASTPCKQGHTCLSPAVWALLDDVQNEMPT